MSKPQIISKIEEKACGNLQQLTMREFEELIPESREKYYTDDSIRDSICIRKNRKDLYVVDEQNEVIALRVEYSARNINDEIKQLKKLKHLQLDRYSWKILDLITEFKNLVTLDLGASFLEDISALKNFSSLQSLDLTSNDVKDLSPLNELKNLLYLDLTFNRLHNLPKLHELKNLQELNLCDNLMSDLSPLKNLKNLQELNLSHNKVSDLSPLEDLKNLKKLNLFNNQVKSLSPLKNLNNLQELVFSRNQVSDLSPLGELKNLQMLEFYSNQVSDLSPLKELTDLQQLYFNHNQVCDLSPMRKLKNLREVRFRSNQVSDLSVLGHLSKLESIDIGFKKNFDFAEPPKEIARQGVAAIRDYFKQRQIVFICYSHQDRDWLERIKEHLKVLELEGIKINLWDDTQIEAGMRWREEIKKAIAESKVAILLVSTSFLASDFIINNELPPLLEKAEARGLTILPVILRHCRFTKVKTIAQFQAINNPEIPLSELSENDRDKVLVQLTDRVEALI